MKWKLSLSHLKELLKWQRNSIYSFSITLFVLAILWFVWYVNNTLYTSHCIITFMSCWETMYMIEIILLNQSKLSLLGVIRQFSLTCAVSCEFVWLLQRYFYFYNNSLFNVTYAVCYLNIKQIAISQERRAIWKSNSWSSFIISWVLSNKTNLIFIPYTL